MAMINSLRALITRRAFSSSSVPNGLSEATLAKIEMLKLWKETFNEERDDTPNRVKYIEHFDRQIEELSKQENEDVLFNEIINRAVRGQDGSVPENQ
jgi:hypothetical protein